MLDVEMLKAMPPGTIFATGMAMDVEDELFMANTGKMLRWVAVRGLAHDWAIYCLPEQENIAINLFITIRFVRDNGNKVCDERHIKMLVPCHDEAYEMYRC